MSDKPRPGLISGIALLAVGLVILVPSGLCTGIFGGGAILDAITHPENTGDSGSLLGMALLFGGPFVLLGGFLVWQGIRQLRRR